MARVVTKTARGRRTCGECRADRAAHEGGGLGHEFEGLYRCEKCGRAIEVGQEYQEVRQKRQLGGVTRRRCSTCPKWLASELTTSEFLARLLEAEESEPDVGIDPDDPVSTIENLEALRDHYAEACHEAAQVRWDAADAMDDGFGHETEISSNLREQGDQADDIGDQLDDVDLSDGPAEDDEEAEDEFVEWAEAKADEIRELFQEALGIS